MKKVGIVIVSYNSSEIMKSCIDAARKACNKNDCLIVVVDNNSKDEIVDVCKKLRVTVIDNKVNYGFAKAVNQGLDFLEKNKCDYFLILNPDAVLGKDSVAQMINRQDSDKNIGAVGPRMIDANGSDASSGYYLKAPSFISVTLFSTHLRKFFINKKWFVRKFYEESPLIDKMNVQQIPGACIFTSKDKLKNIGNLDEDFAIWFEDVEWCYRARKKGYTLSYCNDAIVVHEGGVTFTKWNSPDKAVTFYVSMKTFFRKYKPLQFPFVLISLSINALFSYFKSGDKNQLIFIKKLWKQKRGVLPE